MALNCHRMALQRCGSNSRQAATILHSIALAYNTSGSYREALFYEKKCYTYYK